MVTQLHMFTNNRTVIHTSLNMISHDLKLPTQLKWTLPVLVPSCLRVDLRLIPLRFSNHELQPKPVLNPLSNSSFKLIKQLLSIQFSSLKKNLLIHTENTSFESYFILFILGFRHASAPHLCLRNCCMASTWLLRPSWWFSDGSVAVSSTKLLGRLSHTNWTYIVEAALKKYL